MFNIIQTRWPHLLLTLVMLVSLSPTPVAQPLVVPLSSAIVAIESGRTDSALELLQTAMNFEPALGGMHTQAAEIALAAGEPLQVLHHLNAAALLTSPTTMQACLRSRAMLAIGNTTMAADIWSDIGEACPEPASFIQKLAQAYLQEGDLAASQSALQNLISLKPSDPDPHMSLALVTAMIEPTHALVHLRLANTLSSRSIPLVNALIRAIEDAQLDNEPSYNLAQVGQTFARYNEWEMAVWAFQNALELDPEYVEVRAYLGLALDRAGQDGLSELESAIDAAPSAPLPHIFLALHWQAQGQPLRARQQLEIAARLDPSNPAIAAELGTAYAALGEVRSAIAAYRLATNLAPADPRFWLLLAQFSLVNEIEVQTLGLPAARNAAALDPENPVSLDTLGYAHVLLGNLHLADRFLWRALNSEPRSAASQFHLGLLRQAQGDAIRAQNAFRMAYELDPFGPIGHLAERILIHIQP